MYGAQIATVIAQFAYAAVTSRLVGPSTFGAYAIALSVSGLVTLLASGGIAQAVARMDELEPKRLRALSVFALLLGIVSAGFIWFTASMWANFWGDEQAQSVIELLALSSFVAPLVGISTTVMRRQGSFRLLATVTLVSNLLGMALGSIAVMQFRSGAALTVSAIVSQILLLLGSLLLTKRVLWGVSSIGHARHEMLFSSNLTAIKFAEYLVGNIMKFSTSRWLGSSYFGYWNRADMLATLPFQQVQNALLQTLSPEFRHDIHRPDRAHRVWADLLILVAWFAVPSSAVAAVVFPQLVPILFGQGWGVAAVLAAPLAIAAGLQTVSMVLSSAVESLGKFKWMWVTSIALILIQIVGAAALVFYSSIFIAMACVIATQIARHSLQLVLCSRNGYLDLPRLLRNYMVVMVTSVAMAGLSGLVCWMVGLTNEQPAFWIGVGIVVIGFSFASYRFGSRLPPFVLAQKYGLLTKRRQL